MERASWNDPANIYPDAFYREWLLFRVDAWSAISYVETQLTFVKTMNYEQGRNLLLEILDNLDKKEEQEQHRQNELLRLNGISQQQQQPPSSSTIDWADWAVV